MCNCDVVSMSLIGLRTSEPRNNEVDTRALLQGQYAKGSSAHAKGSSAHVVMEFSDCLLKSISTRCMKTGPLVYSIRSGSDSGIRSSI